MVVQFVKEGLTFSGTPRWRSSSYGILAAVAEFERSLIRERQREGIAVAKAKGVYRGRKKALTEERAAGARSRRKAP